MCGAKSKRSNGVCKPAAALAAKNQGLARILTAIAGFRVQSANRYTTRPVASEKVSKNIVRLRCEYYKLKDVVELVHLSFCSVAGLNQCNLHAKMTLYH